MEPRWLLSNHTWTGAVSSSVSNPSNWDVSPIGDKHATLIFPATGVTNFNVVDDVGQTAGVDNIEITGGGYTISAASGEVIGIASGGVFSANVPTGTTDTITISIEGFGTLDKTGQGVLKLKPTGAADTFTSGTLEAGALANGFNGPLMVTGGIFHGGGGLQGNLAVNGGNIRGGGSSVGNLTVTGDMTLSAGATVLARLIGPNSNTGGHDVLTVTGSINLNGATLNPTIDPSTQDGDAFTIIDNTGSSPIAGAFANHPDGTDFMLGSVMVHITYEGGPNKHNVVIRQVPIPTSVFVQSSAQPAVIGMPVTITATVNALTRGVANGVASGSVTFDDNGVALGSAVTLVNGVASITVPSFTLAQHTITASYAAHGNFEASQMPFGQVVQIGAVVSNGILYVGGNDSANTITVAASGTDFIATVDGTATTVPGAGVTSASITAAGGNDTVTMEAGTTLSANITGGSGDDELHGASGNDTINGGGGNDSITGGMGDDILIGGAGDDTLRAARGNDSLSGGAGNDLLRGGAGNDTLRGGPGNDTMKGGADDDTFFAADGEADSIDGGLGNNQATVDSGLDTVENVVLV
jgi:hypothetical protein